MVRSIVPEGQTDADRIRDFVNGSMGVNKANNRRVAVNALDWVLAYEVARRIRKARKARRGK